MPHDVAPNRFHLVTPALAEDYWKELASMHRLRYRRCVHDLAWPTNGIKVTRDSHGQLVEHDQFDSLATTSHLIHVNGYGRVDACSRLMPTSGPYLLRDEFCPFVDAGFRHYLEASTSLESSRFCVAKRAPKKTLPRLIAAMVDHAVATGHTDIIALSDARVPEAFARLGWPSEPMGAPTMTKTELSLAVRYPVSADVLANIRRRNRLPERDVIVNDAR